MTLREPQRPRPRIESLTDLIFGLALSIGALVLLNNKPGDLDQLLLSIGLFGFSFLILISIWLRYTETMSVLPIETSGTRTLNVLLLFLVALEPYLFNLIGAASTLDSSITTTAYAADIGAVYAILATFNNILTSEGRVLVQPDLVQKYRLIRNLQVGVALIFGISLVPQFYTLTVPIGTRTLPIRYLIWITTLFFSRGTWFLRRLGRL